MSKLGIGHVSSWPVENYQDEFGVWQDVGLWIQSPVSGPNGIEEEVPWQRGDEAVRRKTRLRCTHPGCGVDVVLSQGTSNQLARQIVADGVSVVDIGALSRNLGTQ